MVQPDIYQLIHSKRAEIILLAGKYGASPIRIFGSGAHHTADEKSDVDFLVELAPGRTLFDLGGFAYDLEKLLGRPVDVCTVLLLREPSGRGLSWKRFPYERRPVVLSGTRGKTINRENNMRSTRCAHVIS
jgi:hypothetical protein